MYYYLNDQTGNIGLLSVHLLETRSCLKSSDYMLLLEITVNMYT